LKMMTGLYPKFILLGKWDYSIQIISYGQIQAKNP